MLNRLVESWNRKEQGRDGLVPEAFATPANQRRLRAASWTRGLVAVVVVAFAVVLVLAPSLSTPVLAAVLGVLGVVTVVLVVIAVRALSALARVEREAPGPDGSEPVVGAGHEGAEAGQRIDLEHEHRVQPDDVQ